MKSHDRAIVVVPAGRRLHGENDRLTSRQEEVLLRCVEEGYYEIPRRKTLRALAHELGISATSLSLILRRAEAKLVHAFARQETEGNGRRQRPILRPAV